MVSSKGRIRDSALGGWRQVMREIELTIKTDYLPSWGSYEGIRELIQNGRDAEIELNAPLKVRHVDRHLDPLTLPYLSIENVGVTLPYEVLLLGHTTKVGKEGL